MNNISNQSILGVKARGKRVSLSWLCRLRSQGKPSPSPKGRLVYCWRTFLRYKNVYFSGNIDADRIL